MFDFYDGAPMLVGSSEVSATAAGPSSDLVTRYRGKRALDLALSVLLIIAFAVAAPILLLVNPFLNRGPLFYMQDRMGKDGVRFRALKFRSMTLAAPIARGAFDPLEVGRITPLGRFLRKARIDEIPQVVNVLRGQMSVIGPRPDAYDHACVYARVVPGYSSRHAVLPGITGYAQTEIGYVDGLEGVHRKVAADLRYLRTATLALDLWIAWRTFAVILGRRGA